MNEPSCCNFSRSFIPVAGKVHASSKTRGEMKTDKENVTLSSRNMLDTAERDGDESFESHDETASSGMEDDEDDDDDHDDEDDDDDGEEDEENDVGDHQSIGSNRARPDAVSLPPSPPVNRTAMSLVKERNRSRSSSRSRSRFVLSSSPVALIGVSSTFLAFPKASFRLTFLFIRPDSKPCPAAATADQR